MPHAPKINGFSLLGWLLTSLVVGVGYWWVTRPDLRWWDGVVTHGNPARQAVALTFDDGPHPLWAPLLADTLERHGARGTFFLVGEEALVYPEITTRLARAGHEVGAHSYTHPYPNLTVLPATQVEWEVQASDALLAQFTKHPTAWFRPPGGGINDAVILAVDRHHMRIGWWSYNAADAASPAPATTLYRLTHSLRPGSVVLLHQRENTAAALEQFFAAGGGKEYDCATFSDITRP
jgi:peptidoglycan/xylan/chitin deacetylase (PgdA/CDA1 family)